MSGTTQDILIEVSPGETRVAILRGDGRRQALYELLVDRMSRPSRVGEVVAGRVARVDATGAFIDLGGGESGLIPRARGLNQGKRLAVQIVRDAAGGKGPGLTQSPVLSGRYLSIQPGRAGVTLSRRLGGQRREALEAWVAAHAEPEDGLTLRPASAVVEEAVLTAELVRLRAAWEAIRTEGASVKPGAVLLPAPGLAERVLRDRAEAEGAVGILCDDRRVVSALAATISETMPDLSGALTLHADATPLFEAHGVEEQVEAAAAHRAALPGGGTLVFDETEALTAIDVNMGEADRGGVGRGQSRTDAQIFALNRTAAEEAARHIVLRNLTGLIVIDFISMRNKAHRRDLVEAMRRHLRPDTTGSAVPVDVLGMTAAGLV
ncbi:MAG: ribonuclease E/G, partial [Alphaproteobacteria bacterium]